MLVSSCRLRASLPRSLLPCLPALVPRFFHVVLPSLAESWRHPGVYFQSWKFDGGLGCWYLMQNGWLRCVVDEFCPGLLTFIGSFPWIVSPCGLTALMAWLCSCCYGEFLGLMALYLGCCCGGDFGLTALLGGCFWNGMVAAAAEAAFTSVFDVKIRHAAAALEAAIGNHGLNSLLNTPEAACKYFCNKSGQHAAAATAAALGGIFTFTPVCGDMSEFALAVDPGTWLSGFVVLCAGI